MTSIKEELEAKQAPKTGVWTPPTPKVPADAVTNVSTAASLQVEEDKGSELKGPNGHVVTIKKLDDPTQKFPFLANCSCQFQGRAKTEDDIRTTVQRHFERHE